MSGQKVEFPDPQAKRRGCILNLMKIWLGLGAVVIIIIVVVRNSAVTDPVKIRQALAEWVQFDPPEGFYPYRKNHFWGVTAISFWDQNHANEEGRTTAIVAFIHDTHWEADSAQAWLESRMQTVEAQFGEIEFKVRAKKQEKIGATNWDIIFIYSGLQKMDAEMEPAIACYRFFKTKHGIVQAHTLGLESSFPLEKQIEVLRAIRGT
ncbi:MAG: hypothetical protein H6510_04860 [Acidobacteria bacterium]|nr:hypothetical protein [Acidobacteriota bacterium]